MARQRDQRHDPEQDVLALPRRAGHLRLNFRLYECLVGHVPESPYSPGPDSLGPIYDYTLPGIKNQTSEEARKLQGTQADSVEDPKPRIGLCTIFNNSVKSTRLRSRAGDRGPVLTGPDASKPLEALDIYAAVPVELDSFDPQPRHFALVESIIADFNPVSDFEYLSSVFNHFSSDSTARSWLLRFKYQPTLEKFQEAIMQAI
ncbi:hypothetical protein FZEAL_4151 [Fusarium zealandicum]|uniref:Vid27 PH-like domain-containing protein n=1 Tax=Fusarium zealandicum TaxID=1053134 RepID=A0A8H4UN64_9HYPO|nr:hypothetical protein FZEAL_4151 [Fusarium zealandicum]